MFERILQQMRAKIRQKQYVITLHADEEMAEDNLMLADVEQVILIGKIENARKTRIPMNGNIELVAFLLMAILLK